MGSLSKITTKKYLVFLQYSMKKLKTIYVQIAFINRHIPTVLFFALKISLTSNFIKCILFSVAQRPYFLNQPGNFVLSGCNFL